MKHRAVALALSICMASAGAADWTKVGDEGFEVDVDSTEDLKDDVVSFWLRRPMSGNVFGTGYIQIIAYCKTSQYGVARGFLMSAKGVIKGSYKANAKTMKILDAEPDSTVDIVRKAVCEQAALHN
jgi:hypothetical protein